MKSKSFLNQVIAMIVLWMAALIASPAMADSVTDQIVAQGVTIGLWASAMITLGLGIWAAKIGGRKMGWWP
ncbi:MAG: hypothetical protein V4614_11125 [Pseudomonadota bacterium]